MTELELDIEELEERIAPSAIGNPVPAGKNPQPSGGGGHNNPVPTAPTRSQGDRVAAHGRPVRRVGEEATAAHGGLLASFPFRCRWST